MSTLGDREIVALLNLARRRGVVQPDRVGAVRDLLRTIPGGDAGSDGNVVGAVAAALVLADAPGGVVTDLLAIVKECEDDPEAIAHAQSLLQVAVSAQPPERRRRRRAGAETQAGGGDD